MPKVHDCPRCAAPLRSGDAEVVACPYCGAEVHLARRSRSTERGPKGRTVAARSGDEARRRGWVLAGSVVAMVVAIGAAKWLVGMDRGQRTKSIEKLLRTFEMATSHDDALALFAEHGLQKQDGRITIDVREPRRVRRAELHYGPDKREVVRLQLFGTFDVDAVAAKLREVVPNHVEPQGADQRVQVGDAVLDVSPASILIWHWDSAHPATRDPLACRPRLAAFWGLLRYALFEGSSPDEATRKLIGGPSLQEALSLDRGLVVEQASDGVEKATPVGRCRTMAGITCTVEVDHPLVREANWTWPNALKSRMQHLVLGFRKRPNAASALPAIAACLKPALGEGEERVLDYAKGTRAWSWAVGTAGDRVELLEERLTLTSGEDAKPEQPAAWTAKVDAVGAALARCAP